MARPETLADLLDQHGIRLNEPPKPGRQHGGARSKLRCPQCNGGNEEEKNFYVKIDADGEGATWNCFRASCGFHGGGRVGAAQAYPQRPPKHYRRPGPPAEAPRPEPMLRYFAGFGISEETVRYFGVYQTTRRMPVLNDAGKETDQWASISVLAYPYRDGGGLANCKYKAVYRDGLKRFAQEAGCEPTLYNIDSFTDAEAGYFVEGEDDCLAMLEAGFRQVTSLPNGSPPKLAERYDPLHDDDERYQPLRPGDLRIDRLERCILAGDGDAAGTRHMEEVARRLGKHRCWLVHWPDGCKDAKDTLHKHGADSVRRAVADAVHYPIDGVEIITDAMILDMWERREGWRYATGFPTLDERLKLSDEGLFVCLTGIPGHGKTSFWTSYAGHVVLRHQEEMRFNTALRPFHVIVLSQEVESSRITRNLVSLHANMPFLRERDGGGRVTREAIVSTHMPWVRRHFTFLHWPRSRRDAPTFRWALSTIEACVRQTGAKLAIIDPWQEFDDEMPATWRHTSSKWIVGLLREARVMAWDLKINLILVAHPAKMKREKSGKYAMPVGYDIGDSQGFSSVAQIGLTVWRPNAGSADDDMELHCWKVGDARFGQVGTTIIRFDPHTQRLYPRPSIAEAMDDANPRWAGERPAQHWQDGTAS